MSEGGGVVARVRRDSCGSDLLVDRGLQGLSRPADEDDRRGGGRDGRGQDGRQRRHQEDRR